MNRSMDKFRVAEGILLLASIFVIFLPMLSIWQENYPEQTYSQLSLIKRYLMSGAGAGALPVSGFTRFLTVLFMVLPLFLAAFAGVCSLVEQLYGKYAQIAGRAALCLYLCQFFLGFCLWPKRINDAQQYNRKIGWWLFAIIVYLLLAIAVVVPLLQKYKMGMAGTKAVMGQQHSSEQVGAMPATMPGGRQAAGRSLSGVSEEESVSYTQSDPMSQQTHAIRDQALYQTQTEINLASDQIDRGALSKPEAPEMSMPARGVMVGVAGVFANREVAFQDGETLHLGRDLSNDLVFTNASHISRNHCSITWYAQKQKYYVEDRSSNGCFINGALVRLPKNVEIALDPGTTIDIGDQTNRFRLE